MQAPELRPRDAFRSDGPYRFLPFRFERFDGRCLLTNEVGQHMWLSCEDFEAFTQKRLPADRPAFRILKARHFLVDGDPSLALELLALKYRTRAASIARFTGLHMFVLTLRCNHSCTYCQASRRAADADGVDMSWEHASAALDLTFRSPSPAIKIEFQGGEPLLCFDLLKGIVERAVELNRVHGKDLAFVIASNLSLLDDHVIEFCRQYRIALSTSLDGPVSIHDEQRIYGQGGHARTVEGIRFAQSALGRDAVCALMTTTAASLDRPEDIVDEYVKHGFSSIFLRGMSPYGFAARAPHLKYDTEAWLRFYRRALAYILKVNKGGTVFSEEFAAILLRKICSPEGTSYVDLQSPAGLGIAGVVYNYDGWVYGSDEGRMLSEMGDSRFRLGHVARDSYESIFTSDALLGPLDESMLEGIPMCCDCVFQPYCGADPVRHVALQGDAVGHKAFSELCKKQRGVLTLLLDLLDSDAVTRELLLSWA